MGVNPYQQGLYGVPTGYAAGLQSLLTPMLAKSGGNYSYTPKDYLMSVMASGAGKSGLLPSLLGGLGQAYLYNKQAEAMNQQAQMEEQAKQEEALKQQNAQRKLAEYYGVKPEYLEAAAIVSKPEILKQFLEQGQTGAEVGNTNTYLRNIDMPELEGLPSREYQNAIMNTYNTLIKNLPEINEQNMKNQILEQTMPSTIQSTNAKNNITIQTAPGEISATNAKNQADTRFAVPQAQANLVGKQLSNQGQAIDNRFAPQIKQGTIRNQNINAQQMQMNIIKAKKIQEEMQGLTNFSQTLNQLNSQTKDPNEFRTKAIQTLMQMPVSSQGKQQLMQDIDTMTVIKMKQPKQQGNNPAQPKKSGLFGLNY